VTVLATTKTALHLIPWLLAFVGLIVLLLLGGVFAVTLSNPSKLMLGQVSGTEYAEIHRAVIGDSLSGKKVITIGPDFDQPSVERGATASQPLPASPTQEQEA
jgi:hypothetical protein